MRTKIYIVLFLAVVSIVGCGKKQIEQNIDEDIKVENAISIEDKIEEVSEIETPSLNITETEIEEIEQEDNGTEDIKEPEILHFVDVFGEEYEVEINDRIEKTPYNNAVFERTENSLKYEDDIYSSRMGVDVSRHQGTIDWKSVKEAGIEFAFIRIGYRGYGKEGSINLDQQFKNNIEKAQNEGIDVGVYFFAQAINEEEAREEARFVIEQLKDYDLQLPVVYDPESILDAEARTDDVTGEQFTKNTEVFCSMIKEAGYNPMIYSNMLWEAYELDLEELSEYPIWYADYEEYPQTPYMYEFWQYSNEGRVNGISGRVDLNIQLIRK